MSFSGAGGSAGGGTGGESWRHLFGYAQDTLPPTGVTHAVAARLFAAPTALLSDTALVVVRTSLLQVYGIVRSAAARRAHRLRRLVLLAEDELAGTVCELATVRAPGADRDALLVSFFDAKVSVLQYDAATARLAVRTLHAFERAEHRAGAAQLVRGPWLAADPQARCAAALVYDRSLAIIPIGDDGASTATGTTTGTTTTATADELFAMAMDDDDDDDDDEEEEGEEEGMDTNNKKGDGDNKSEKSKKKRKKTIRDKSYVCTLEEMGLGQDLEAMVFLHGCFEPCLFAVYAAGVARETKAVSGPDVTCTAAALALDTRARRSTVLWRVPRLPRSCTTVCAVLAPLGGALVLGPNVVVHCGAAGACWLALNDFGVAELRALGTPAFDTSPFEDVLEEPRTLVPLAPDLYLLGTRNGDRYYIALAAPDGRTVRALTVRPADLSGVGMRTIPSCMCVAPAEKLLFLGSRYADSLAVRYSRLDKPHKSSKKGKKGSAGSGGDLSAAAAAAAAAPPALPSVLDDKILDDDDAAFFAGSTATATATKTRTATATATKKDQDDGMMRDDRDDRDEKVPEVPLGKRYGYVLVDFLTSLGTVRDYVVTESNDASSKSLADVQQSVLQARGTLPPNGKTARWELAACTGYGPTGSLTIVQSDVRPEVRQSFANMAGSLALWTLPLPGKHDPTQDDFLLVSQPHGTLVFRPDCETLLQLQPAEAGFVADQATLYAAPLMDATFTVQVVARGLVLLCGLQRVLEWAAPPGFDIVAARALHAAVALVSLDGRALLLRIAQDNPAVPPVIARVAEPPPVLPGDTADRVTCASLFEHDSRVLLAVVHMSGIIQVFDVDSTAATPTETSTTSTSMTDTPAAEAGTTATAVSLLGPPVFVAGFGNFDSVVHNLGNSGSSLGGVLRGLINKTNVTNPPLIAEAAFLVPAPQADAALHVFLVLATGDLVVYRAAPECCAEAAARALPLQFVRVDHRQILREPPQPAVVLNMSTARRGREALEMLRFLDRGCHLVPYADGLVYCGKRPAFVYSDHGLCRVVPMEIDGRLLSAAPFNNSLAPHSFVALTGAPGTECMRICQLSSEMGLEGAVPLRRIPLGVTPMRIDYDSYHKMLVVAVAVPVLLDPQTDFDALVPETDRAAPPPRPPLPSPGEHYEIWLFNPRTNFERVHVLPLGKNEVVTALTVASLATPNNSQSNTATTSTTSSSSSGTSNSNSSGGSGGNTTTSTTANNSGSGSGTQSKQGTNVYVAVGVTSVVSERFQCTHTLRLCEIVSRRVAGGQYEYTMHDVCHGEINNGSGALTALASCFNGQLVVGVKNTLAVMALKVLPEQHDLRLHTSMVFTQAGAITEVHSRSSSVLAVNAWKGLTFQQLSSTSTSSTGAGSEHAVSRECRAAFITAAEFVRDLRTTVAADIDANLFVSVFEGEGCPLLPRADYHLGARVGKFVRLGLLDPLKWESSSAAAAPLLPQKGDNTTRLFALYATFEGSLGVVRVLDEKTHLVLEMLQERMVDLLPHPAGLNPRAYRLVHHTSVHAAPLRSRAKNILDGNLLLRYLALPYDVQLALAKGTTPEIIISSLAEIAHSVNYLQ